MTQPRETVTCRIVQDGQIVKSYTCQRRVYVHPDQQRFVRINGRLVKLKEGNVYDYVFVSRRCPVRV